MQSLKKIHAWAQMQVPLSDSQIDIVTYVTSCYKLTPRLTECKHFLLNAP